MSKAQQATREPTLTEGAPTALQHELELAHAALPFEERIRKLQEEYAALGNGDPDVNMKVFFDEMWGHG